MIGTDLLYAQKLLEGGKLVAIPTETVYGLAANAFDADAVADIFEVKQRPTFDPLIVHTNSISKLASFVSDIPKKAGQLAEAFWPGPLTLVLPKTELIPSLVTSGLDTVGVRIPNHDTTLALLENLSFPLAAPSANTFGYISPTQAQHVDEQLGNKIPYILDGGSCEIGIESTIVGFEEGEAIVYRLGGISLEEIEAVIGEVNVSAHSASNPKAPGMMNSHYSPQKKMLLGNIKDMLNAYDKAEISILSFDKSYNEIDSQNQYVLSEVGNIHEAAKNLFDALRQLDKNRSTIILTELLPERGLGRAINDRLRRASVQ